MSQIQVDNLTKEFGQVVALDDVSFEIERGEFAVVLGPSGSGKSTLLRTMNGLTKPTQGTVTVDDHLITEPHPEIAMIFQQHNIIGDLSAYSNALTGSLRRNSTLRSVFQFNDVDDKYKALHALDTVGLLEEAQQQASRMSGGQQQRVGIARALVQEPKILLADEPVASLDPGSSQRVMGYLLRASQDRGLTTLVSLHQVNLARQFGERFIGLRDGEVVFDGYEDEFTWDVVDEIYEDVDLDALQEEGRPGGSSTESQEAGRETPTGVGEV